MKLLVDTHTHTVISGHTFSTLYENILFASRHGLEALVSTEHGPLAPGAQPTNFMSGYQAIPDTVDGVRVYCGIEADIVDYTGVLDIEKRCMEMTQFAIASLHEVCIDPGTPIQNTDALIGALNNPYIDIIGHPGNPHYLYDYEAVVKEAKRLNKLLEVNNYSFNTRHVFRAGSRDTCKKIIGLAKKHGVRISVGSDAHFCANVGKLDMAVEVLEEAGYPEEMVVSRNLESFQEYLKERQARIAAQKGR